MKGPNNIWMRDKAVDKNRGQEYYNKLYLEMFPSLYKNKKVILTNARRWEFFEWERVDAELKSCLEVYIQILELCTSDHAEDYAEIKQKLESKKASEEKEKLLEFLDDFFVKKLQMITKPTLKEIVTLADNIYLDDIKKCIVKAKTDTFDIINNNGILITNPSDKNTKTILLFDAVNQEHGMETLYHKLNKFLDE